MGRRGDTWHNSSLTLASRSISTYINSPDMLYVCIYSTFYTVAAARLGELCSGDIDITTPAYTRKTRTNFWGLLLFFFLRRVFKMSDGPVLVRLRRNQSGSQWGFTMQGGYDQGSCLYIQKVRKPCVYYIQFWKYDIRSYRRKRPCLVSSTTCARPQLKPRF